jgi:glutathione S-transferase
MSSQLKPIKVYGKGGPNPPKVAIVLEELGIPYEVEDLTFEDIKKEYFLSINPNGRMPAIYDPNTDLTLWESGAILEYLIEKYDTEHKISFVPGSAEYFLAKQWLFFQTSGQGPYYGQAIWFKRLHSEPLPSAVQRYIKEINRVTGVLDNHLAKQAKGSEGPWLVGGKLSYADIAFYNWQAATAKMLEKDEFNLDDYPHVKKWLEKLEERDSIKKIVLVPTS